MGISLFYSFLLHGILLVLIFVQFPSWMTPYQEKTEVVPIFIDLKNIEISDKTNLPKEIKKQEKSLQRQEKKEVPAVSPKPKPTLPKVQAAEKPSQKSASLEEKKKEIPSHKVKTKPIPKVTPPKQEKKVLKIEDKEDSLDSLLASVEKMSKSLSSKQKKQTDKKENSSLGVKGGVSSNLSQNLTISELDFISMAIRKNWNLDPGAEGIDKMIIEIRIALDRSGKVYNVDIIDKKRYHTDMSFRSVAESARRAIYICDGQGVESPFRILASKRPDSYDQWKEMVLRFNPIDGGVF